MNLPLKGNLTGKTPLILTQKKRKIWTSDFSEDDIKKVFADEPSPLMALARMQDFSLPWLISKIFCNQRGRPLRLAPFQRVMLRLLWNKKFPILLACRGSGKCVSGNTICNTNHGFLRIDEIIDSSTAAMRRVSLNLDVRGENGYYSSDYGWNNGTGQTKKIRTRFGYEIEGTLNHPIRVLSNNGNIIWKHLSDIKNNDIIPINRSECDFGNDSTLTEDQSYWVGLTLGNGMVTQPSYIAFTNIDNDLINFWSTIGMNWAGAESKFTKHKNKPTYYIRSKIFAKLINENIGLEYKRGRYKSIPKIIRQAPKKIVAACLSGLWDTDGGCTNKGLEYCSKSKDLAEQMHILLLAFGIIAKKRYKKVSYTYNGTKKIKYAFSIEISSTENISRFRDTIGFRCARKQEALETLCNRNSNPNIDVLPHYFYDRVSNIEDSYAQTFDLHVPDDHSFISNGFISHNSFMLGLYALLKGMLSPGNQIIIVGAAFRQSKIVFGYIEKLYNQSPLIQESLAKFGGPKMASDQAYINIGSLSKATALPIGDGEKIRGMRSNITIVDEFGSINPYIFETVISPFAAVHANPEERARIARFCKRLLRLGAAQEVVENLMATQGYGNQIIVSGTATYKFNHFYKRYAIDKMIIDSNGDPDKIRRALQLKLKDEGKTPEVSEADVAYYVKNWKNYAIYQLPYEGIPDEFLDREIVENDRLTFTKTRFDMEYRCIFADDSDGFIRRSEIHEATPKDPPLKVELYGEPGASYVLGLDPAKHNDNFAAVVLKIKEGMMSPVYCDAWERTDYTASTYKIREIVRRFNIQYIAMDAAGGGTAVREHLCRKDLCQGPGDFPIWCIPDQLEDKGQRSLPGPNILHMVNWTAHWIRDNAHALQADMQHGRLQFVDDADLQDAFYQYERHFNKPQLTEHEKSMIEKDLYGIDQKDITSYGEGIWDNLQEMINEMCAIERRVTPAGTEQFELPKLIEQPEGLDIRRRDRWSALVLAAFAARIYMGHGHKRNFNVNVAGSPHQIRSHASYVRRGRGRAKRKGSTFYR